MEKKLSIVHVISSLHRGGAENVLLSLVRELQKRGWQQTVLYIYDGPIREELMGLGIACHCFFIRGGYLNPLMWYRLLSHIRFLRPQALHTSLWAANFMGRIVGEVLGIRTVSSLHAVAAHEGPVRNIFDRYFPVRAGITIAVSQSIADSVIAARMYKKNDVIIVLNGIDSEKFLAAARSNTEVPYIRSPEEWVIGAVGRLVPVKRFDLLINAFAECAQSYRNLRLLIIGTGPEEKKLRALMATKPCAVHITLITNQRAAPYYRYFDCFVQASQYEGLSLALLEALTMKVPVIVTGHNGAHEVITNRVDGLVIPPNNEQDLRKALGELLTNPNKTNSLREAGYKKVMRSYTLHHMVDGYERVFVRQVHV